MSDATKAGKSVEIAVRVECRPGTKGDGAWWEIVEIVDERHQWLMGDSGVYEFDAEYGMPQAVIEYVLTTLGESGEFNDMEASFSIDIRFCEGGFKLGRSFMRFTGHDTLDWPFRVRS